MVSIITRCMIELGFEEHLPSGDKIPQVLQLVRSVGLVDVCVCVCVWGGGEGGGI